MALRVEDASCNLARVFGCQRGTCWATVQPMRMLCRECYRTTFGSYPE